ncbi:MAG: hypothetical protein KGP28_01870 [Bdellovibrionales bacterium]|nr:hypothetical protein [Bdellovibrionales bacterium]
MKARIRSVFFILCMFSSSGQAMELDCPESLKPRLPTLTLNQNVVIREGEKHSFGRILKRGENFPNLNDGPYVFILDRDQNLVFSERFPDFDEVAPVVTHRSLYRKLEEHLGTEPTLIALGEIHFDNGVISSVNNKAGTAFLPNEYLPELAAVLKERGLPITPETPIVPFDKVRPEHDTEHQIAAFRSKIERDPRLKALNEKLLDFRREAQKRFPRQDSPGMVHWEAFLESQTGPNNRFAFSSMADHERIFLGCFSLMETMNSRYRVIPTLNERLTPEELDYLISNLYRFEGSFLR